MPINKQRTKLYLQFQDIMSSTKKYQPKVYILTNYYQKEKRKKKKFFFSKIIKLLTIYKKTNYK